MKLQKDLREFIELLNSHKVEYLVVGGHAVAWHGYPRFTGDIDFFIRISEANAGRVTGVLRSFGFPTDDGLTADLLAAGKVIQLGRAPNRIDILTGISGVTFDEAIVGSVEAELDGVPVRMIGLQDLMRNKSASGRSKDIVDVNTLKKRSCQ